MGYRGHLNWYSASMLSPPSDGVIADDFAALHKWNASRDRYQITGSIIKRACSTPLLLAGNATIFNSPLRAYYFNAAANWYRFKKTPLFDAFKGVRQRARKTNATERTGGLRGVGVINAWRSVYHESFRFAR